MMKTRVQVEPVSYKFTFIHTYISIVWQSEEEERNHSLANLRKQKKKKIINYFAVLLSFQ